MLSSPLPFPLNLAQDWAHSAFFGTTDPPQMKTSSSASPSSSFLFSFFLWQPDARCPGAMDCAAWPGRSCPTLFTCCWDFLACALVQGDLICHGALRKAWGVASCQVPVCLETTLKWAAIRFPLGFPVRVSKLALGIRRTWNLPGGLQRWSIDISVICQTFRKKALTPSSNESLPRSLYVEFRDFFLAAVEYGSHCLCSWLLEGAEKPHRASWSTLWESMLVTPRTSFIYLVTQHLMTFHSGEHNKDIGTLIKDVWCNMLTSCIRDF